MNIVELEKTIEKDTYIMKKFSTDVVLTVYTDTMLADDMLEVHRCYEFIIGRSFFNAQIVYSEIPHSCRKIIAKQFPDISKASDILSRFQTVHAGNIKEIRKEIYSVFGKEIELYGATDSIT